MADRFGTATVETDARICQDPLGRYAIPILALAAAQAGCLTEFPTAARYPCITRDDCTAGHVCREGPDGRRYCRAAGDAGCAAAACGDGPAPGVHRRDATLGGDPPPPPGGPDGGRAAPAADVTIPIDAALPADAAPPMDAAPSPTEPDAAPPDAGGSPCPTDTRGNEFIEVVGCGEAPSETCRFEFRSPILPFTCRDLCEAHGETCVDAANSDPDAYCTPHPNPFVDCHFPGWTLVCDCTR